ncbi:hypothetical protein PGT21_003528 [Puccinia graminis f. sp. tritici]|uniref:Uncharacterized protein n=1 Tax=Puccinia graminis f. sp. tritici TaxID=56615 RepID=A0A5B0Q521_PUCGR|nr:hypothetical protein PGT21_003528 [Puccinia graminis f. sp. tritici]
MLATTWAILFEDYIVGKQPIHSKHMSVDTTRIDSTGMSLRHKISVTCESQSPTKLITALLAPINRGPSYAYGDGIKKEGWSYRKRTYHMRMKPVRFQADRRLENDPSNVTPHREHYADRTPRRREAQVDDPAGWVRFQAFEGSMKLGQFVGLDNLACCVRSGLDYRPSPRLAPSRGLTR